MLSSWKREPETFSPAPILFMLFFFYSSPTSMYFDMLFIYVFMGAMYLE